MDGMNEAGFAVSVLHLDGKPTQQASTGKKLTTTLALRMMLDHAKTVDEALKILDGYDLCIPDMTVTVISLWQMPRAVMPS